MLTAGGPFWEERGGVGSKHDAHYVLIVHMGLTNHPSLKTKSESNFDKEIA